MNRVRACLLVGSWLMMGWTLGCGGEPLQEPEEVGEARGADRTAKIGAPLVTSPVDVAPRDGKVHVCVDTASTTDCDYQLSGQAGAVRVPLSGSVSVTAAGYVFDPDAIASLRTGGYAANTKGKLLATLDNVSAGCDVVSGTTSMSLGTAGFWDSVTLSSDQKTLSWNMTGSAAPTFDDGGCSQYRAPVHVTMDLLLPLVYSANGSKIDASLLVSTDQPTSISTGTTFYQLPPITLTNDNLDDGAKNDCSAPQVLSVQPGWSVNVTGKTAIGTSDYYTFRFDGAGGIPSWFMPSLTLSNTAGGQYAMQVKTPGCGGYAQSGANCGGNLTAWSQSFPANPNGCNNTYGGYTCSDASPRMTEVVVQVIRLSGAATDQYYTLTATNCNGACSAVFATSTNGVPSGDGYSNTCGGAEYYDVQPGTSFDLSGHIPAAGGSDYFIANFQGVPGAGQYYHPKIDLVSDAGGQYRFLAYGVGCSAFAQGGTNCNGTLQTWEQAFALNPNGCNGSYGGNTCSDGTARVSQVVVQVVRTGVTSSAFANYTVRLSNQ